MALKKLYGEISKVEAQDDGTLKVWGIASTPATDSDGEIITADAMKAAIPDYMKFGAIREMHQPSAAGTALEIEVDENGATKVCAHVVDSEAVKKVQTGVYKGFSIGGKVTGRDELQKTTITGIKLVEISLVDRPANPEAVIECFKADGIEEDPAPSATPEPAAEPVAKSAEPLRKSMWSVSDFAQLLAQLSWLASDAAYEASYEGDNSPIPGRLRDWLQEGADILVAMTAEEVAELMASLPQPPDVVIELAAKKDDLAKVAGANDAIAKACAAAGLEEGGEIPEFIVKLAADRAELTEKVAAVTAEKDEIEKGAKALQAEAEEWLKMVKPAKGVLRAIGKGEDLGAGEMPPEVIVKDSHGKTDTTASLIKAVHQGHR